MATINVNVDENIKEEAKKTLEDLGTNFTNVINMLLRQIILTESIPFEIKLPKFSDEMLSAIAESEKIMKNPDNYPSYNSVSELMEALDEK